MDVENVNVNDVAYIETVEDDSHQEIEESVCNNILRQEAVSDNLEPRREALPVSNEIAEKHSVIWTNSATLILLNLYETKLEMLETPKKKTRIWIAISEGLKDHEIEVTPDQVRWKINALSKKYKHCLENEEPEKFRYFKEMENIYARYNVDCDSYSLQNEDQLENKKFRNRYQKSITENVPVSAVQSGRESKGMIGFRKLRLANRIHSDRTQSKITLEKQWLEYLKRQDVQRTLRDELHEKSLKLREEELELRKRELELKQSVELKRIELIEKEQDQLFKIEREKCDMLKCFCAKLRSNKKVKMECCEGQTEAGKSAPRLYIHASRSIHT